MELSESRRLSVAESRQARIARGKANPDLIPHGKSGTRSNWGCDCRPCKDADNARGRRRRERRQLEVAGKPNASYAISMRPLTPA